MSKRPPRYGVKQDKEINTLLIDGNSLFKVAYFGAKNEYNYRGEHIGGLYSFLIILRKLLVEDLYHRVYVFWDGNFSGKLRYEIYGDYKSGRGKNFIEGTKPDDLSELAQRKLVWDYLNELYIRQLKDEVIESDDFIAYYCLNKKPNEKITIVSGDGDFLQLITPDIRIYSLKLKKYLTIDNFMDFLPYHQTNSVLVKTMTGDVSDSIKGIKGLGEDTLIKYFPEIRERTVTLSEILDSAKEQQSKRKNEKKKPIKVFDNIINRVTDGIQKENVYVINERLVNLSKPMMTENGIRELNELMEGTLDSSGRELKTVFSMMKRDGLDKAMGEVRFADFLIPFKKLIDRENNI